MRLTEADSAWLRSIGRDPAEVERQLEVLAGPAPTARLVRPATAGDGIIRLSERELHELAAVGEGVARAPGRLSWFIPASGAATRMSAALYKAWRGEDLSVAERRVVDKVCTHADHLAAWPEMQRAGAQLREPASILDSLFGPGGLSLDRCPKGLVAFHPGGRTPVAAHLIEASRIGVSEVVMHFTVGPAWRPSFEAEVAKVAEREGIRCRVSLSVQAPHTDTVSLDEAGGPVRDADGHPAFRPGGHGALLENLAALDGDVVLVRNIDNVCPEAELEGVVQWRRAMVGLLERLRREAAELTGTAAGLEQLRRWTGSADPERWSWPWRVAGMVRNEGQAGGGPFWVDGSGGPTLQIVEAAQVAPEQQGLLERSTHFNPVDMALGVRAADGSRFDLTRHADPSAWIITSKVQAGKSRRVLERPGLWNGGMARWNTVFVEIPPWMFRPVKTLADLLGRAHGGPPRVMGG